MMITNGLVTGTPKKSAGPAIGPLGGETEPDCPTILPNLLDWVRDWGDRPAWADFFDRYDPLRL